MHRFEPGRGLVPDPLREAYPYVNLFAVKDTGALTRRP
jgi:hypothetical protein